RHHLRGNQHALGVVEGGPHPAVTRTQHLTIGRARNCTPFAQRCRKNGHGFIRGIAAFLGFGRSGRLRPEAERHNQSAQENRKPALRHHQSPLSSKQTPPLPKRRSPRLDTRILTASLRCPRIPTALIPQNDRRPCPPRCRGPSATKLKTDKPPLGFASFNTVLSPTVHQACQTILAPPAVC